jgi:hypothetical protein
MVYIAHLLLALQFQKKSDYLQKSIVVKEKMLSFPCGLRGPDAADLHRPRYAAAMETSPPRHPSAQLVLEYAPFRR